MIAMKSACNELKGAEAVLQSGVPNLCLPLMALIHYRFVSLIELKLTVLEDFV